MLQTKSLKVGYPRSRIIPAASDLGVFCVLADKCHLEDVFGGVEESFATENVSAGADAKKDALEALVALGYSASEAAGAVRKLQVTEEMSVEDILKLSLKNL